MKKIGLTIKEIRNKKRITQEQLSKRTGLSVNYISRLENGSRWPSWITLTKISEVLGISVDFLLLLSIEIPSIDKELDRISKLVGKESFKMDK